jgi:hypothetical protein
MKRRDVDGWGGKGRGGEGLGGSRWELKSGGEGFNNDNLFSFEVKIYLYGNRRTKTCKHSYVKKRYFEAETCFQVFFF